MTSGVAIVIVAVLATALVSRAAVFSRSDRTWLVPAHLARLLPALATAVVFLAGTVGASTAMASGAALLTSGPTPTTAPAVTYDVHQGSANYPASGASRTESAQEVRGGASGTLAVSLAELLAPRGLPAPSQLAQEVAEATGGTIKQLPGGFTVNIPHGPRGIVVRVMEEGGGRTNYFRVSIPGKEAFTITGQASVDRALTHIAISQSSLDDILRIVRQASGQ